MGFCCQSAFQKPVVVRVVFDDFQFLLRFDPYALFPDLGKKGSGFSLIQIFPEFAIPQNSLVFTENIIAQAGRTCVVSRTVIRISSGVLSGLMRPETMTLVSMTAFIINYFFMA